MNMGIHPPSSMCEPNMVSLGRYGNKETDLIIKTWCKCNIDCDNKVKI
jgi:hypothetical protein